MLMKQDNSSGTFIFSFVCRILPALSFKVMFYKFTAVIFNQHPVAAMVPRQIIGLGGSDLDKTNPFFAPWKINVEPEHHLREKENHRPNLDFGFRMLILLEKTHPWKMASSQL